jgi:anti-anti-sigma factor
MLLEIAVDENARSARLQGELDLSTIEVLASSLAPTVAARGDLTLDMGEVGFIDSTGLHALLGIADALDPDGRLILRRPRRGLRRLIEIAGIEDRFELVDPIED